MSTIPEMFREQVNRRGDATAMLVFRGDGFAPITWRDLGEDVTRLAAQLADAGVEPGDRVAQAAANSYAWIVTDLAILSLGAVHVPIHATLSGAQVAWQIADSEAKVAILGDAEQQEKLAPHQSDLPEVRLFSRNESGALIALLTEDLPSHQSASSLQSEIGNPQSAIPAPSSPATLLYTSGTTGRPRGVLLSQGNLASNAIGTSRAFGEHEDEVRLCFLPLSHIYARTCDLYTWIHRGTVLALARSRETIVDDAALVRPTMLNGVPYFYEKLCQRLEAAGKANEPGVLRDVLGGRIRFCFSGGAALPPHVEEFFARQEVPLLQGYGLSETSPVITASTIAAHRRGAAGRAIEGVEVRIADDGEILTRGPHVMLGYWKDEAATRETIRDGWLHTGDLGRLDDDGFLTITGRKKEIIVTSAGKNVAPTAIEARLTASPLVAQAMVVGEGRKCLGALIVPDPDRLREEIISRGIAVTSREQALVHEQVLALYRDEIDRRLADLGRHEQIGCFALVGRAFAIEQGELTPKASLCRQVIAEHFADVIEEIYS